jgi:hypothetical protein
MYFSVLALIALSVALSHAEPLPGKYLCLSYNLLRHNRCQRRRLSHKIYSESSCASSFVQAFMLSSEHSEMGLLY